MKVHIYANNNRFVTTGSARLGPHGEQKIKEIDLGEPSEEDKKRVHANPHDDALLAEIQKKRVR